MNKAPDAFRTISEVAEILDTPAHVLRFWESRFNQLRPVKRAGGRRYYRPSDLALLAGIRKLLHEDGMTIRGVQKLLRERGVKHVASLAPLPDALREADDLPEGMTADTPEADTDSDADADGAAIQAALDSEPPPCPPESAPPEPAPQDHTAQDDTADDLAGSIRIAATTAETRAGAADDPAEADPAPAPEGDAPAPPRQTEAARLRALPPGAARRQRAAFKRLHAQLRDLHARVEAQARTLR